MHGRSWITNEKQEQTQLPSVLYEARCVCTVQDMYCIVDIYSVQKALYMQVICTKFVN